MPDELPLDHVAIRLLSDAEHAIGRWLAPSGGRSTRFSLVLLCDFGDFERLVEAARVLDPRTHLIVLLRSEAGLRCGEMIALKWIDVDLVKRQLTNHTPTGTDN
jgi:integrase